MFHGAGIKVKVVEALALGTPVLGSAVAWEGIDLYLPLGEHTRIVDTPEEYVRILENRRLVTIAAQNTFSTIVSCQISDEIHFKLSVT